MNSIQTFLLEVIVERMDIREKTRDRQKVGFNKGISSSGSEWIVTPNNSKLSARNQSAPEPVNSGPLPCSVTIAFSDLDPIVINEDSSNLWDAEFKSKGEDPKEGKLEEAQAEKELEDKKQARAAGLSPKEYQDSKKKNPNLTEKRFTRGKSTLIRMQPSEMIELLKTEKLFVHVEGGKTIPWTLGDAVVEFPANFVDAVVVAAYSSAMREMISREGHIWWPKELYRTVMLKEVRKAQKELERRKALELTQEEKDLPVRFKNLCELDPLPHPCPICEQEGDECHWKPLTYKDIAPPKPPKKKKNTKIDKKGQAWLMYPSPEPITPPPLPTTAQMTEIADVVNQSKKPTAIVSLFVRLSCFGNSLNLNRRVDPFPD